MYDQNLYWLLHETLRACLDDPSCYVEHQIQGYGKTLFLEWCRRHDEICSGGFAADDTSVYGDRRFRGNGAGGGDVARGGVSGGGGGSGGGGSSGGGGGYNSYDTWEMNNNNNNHNNNTNNMRGGGGNNSGGGMYNDDYGGPPNQGFYTPQQPPPPPPPPQMMGVGGSGGTGNQGPMRPLIDSYNPSPSSQTQQVWSDRKRSPLLITGSTYRPRLGNDSTRTCWRYHRPTRDSHIPNPSTIRCVNQNRWSIARNQRSHNHHCR